MTTPRDFDHMNHGLPFTYKCGCRCAACVAAWDKAPTFDFQARRFVYPTDGAA